MRKGKNIKYLIFITGVLLMFMGAKTSYAAPDTPVASNPQSASTWSQFVAHVNNPAVDQINVTANLTATSNITAANFPVRTLTITGGSSRHTINMSSYIITLGNPTAARLLTVENIDFIGSSATAIFNHTAASGTNWTLHFKGSTLATLGNVKILAILTYGTIYFSEETMLRLSSGTRMITANKVHIEDEFSYMATNATNTGEVFVPFMLNSVANGTLTMTDATVNLRTGSNLVNNRGGASSTFVLSSTNSTLNVNYANAIYDGDGPTNINFVNSTTVFNTFLNDVFSTGAVNAPITANFDSSSFTGTSSGYLVRSGFATSNVKTTFNETPIAITDLRGVVQAANAGSTTTADFTNSNIDTSILRGAIVSGGRIYTNFVDTDIEVATNFTASGFQVLGTGTTLISGVTFTRSGLKVRQSTTTDITFASFAGTTRVVFDDSTLDMNIVGRVFDYLPTAAGSQLRMINGTQATLQSSAKQIVYDGSTTALSGTGFLLEIDGEGTDVNFNNNNNSDLEATAAGIISILSPNAKVKASNKAKFNLKTLNKMRQFQLIMQNDNVELEVSEESKVTMTKTGQSTNNYSMIFMGSQGRTTTNNKITVSGQSLLQIRTASINPAIRLDGKRSEIYTRSGGKLDVYNAGELPRVNVASYNAAVGVIGSTNGGLSNHVFSVEDEDSSLSLVSDVGAVFAGNTTRDVVQFSAGDNTNVLLRGEPYSRVALVSSHRIDVNFGRMKYYDFQNKSSLEPTYAKLFAGNNGSSTLNVQRNNLALWKIANTTGNPAASFANASFSASGASFQTINSASPLLLPYLQANPIYTFGRMNGNNQGAKVKEIRVPTNADKAIWLHATVPEGPTDVDRDAYTDEVTVKVAVDNPDGSLAYEAQGKSVGEGLSVYGTTRKGMVKIPVPNGAFFTSGQKVRIVSAWRGNGLETDEDSIVSEPEDLASPVTGIDVTPPNRTTAVPSISNTTKQLMGESDENGATVFVKVNNDWLKDDSDTLVSTTVTNSTWTINLPRYLTKDDHIDVYLKDNTVLSEVPEFDLPDTYTEEPNGVYGNLNVAVDGYDSYVGFHDAIYTTGSGGTDNRFDSALRLNVADHLPHPTLLKSVVSSSGTETSVGDTLTYTLVTSNTNPDAADWRNVRLVDVLPEGLTFDPIDNGLTINGTPATSSDFTFDSNTRTLSIMGGDIAAEETLTVTFKTTVSQGALNQEINNQATGFGETPQEEPFIPGPVNPSSDYTVLSVVSNLIGIPGESVIGTLRLASAPETINFGQVTYDATTKRVDNPALDKQLIVSDTREITTGGWSLTASLSEPMKNSDGKELKNALRYVRSGVETILNENAQLVYSDTSGTNGNRTVSDTWGTTLGSDGLKLEIGSSDTVYTGDYVGVITWQVMAGQP